MALLPHEYALATCHDPPVLEMYLMRNNPCSSVFHARDAER